MNSPGRPGIAILITSHNRRDQTLECLDALFRQPVPEHISLQVLLLDDGSTDGTAEAVSGRHPTVEIFPGDGSLYWNRGMHRIFEVALTRGYDFYLWLNDDTVLIDGALTNLMTDLVEVSSRTTAPVIVVGGLRDPSSGVTTYGGLKRTSRLRSLHYRLLDPTGHPQPCDSLSGNVVLIPGGTARAVGNLDPFFRHMFGDVDYGMRAVRQGAEIWLASEYTGTCKATVYPWRTSGLGPKQMLAGLRAPKGLHFKELWRHARRHGGPLWPVLAISPYLRAAALGLRPRRR